MAIPIHYGALGHFREGREAIERELARAPEDVRGRFRWLPIALDGSATDYGEERPWSGFEPAG
jgi:hypothetical protein